MTYIEFPRYAVYLIPEKNFNESIKNFYKKYDSYRDNHNSILKYGLHVTIKAPFYINTINNEIKIKKVLLELNNEIDKPNNLNLKKIEYKLIKENNYLILELKVDEAFKYFSSQVVRRFDEFRKVLSPSDYKKDLSRFKNLNENQKMYYQIWGYPFLFEEAKYHIALLDLNNISKAEIIKLEKNINIILSKFKSIDLSNISLCKQSDPSSNFYFISNLDL